MSSVKSLLSTISTLRSPEGCPWNRAQTHRTLKKYLLEETYEVLQAIDDGSARDLKEELGDLLLQICLHAQIAADNGDFDFEQIADGVNQKMVSRHPHVFQGERRELNQAEIDKQWEELKRAERAEKQDKSSPFSGIPAALPSLARAVKVLKKADKENLDYQEFLGTTDLVNLVHNEADLARVLLLLVHRAKILKLDPEETLRMETAKLQCALEQKLEQNPNRVKS